MKYDVELVYGIGFTVTGVEAGSEDEAIEKAKALAEQTEIVTGMQVDAGCLEYDQCSFIEQSR